MQFCKDCNYHYLGDWGGHTSMCNNPVFSIAPDPVHGVASGGYCSFIRKGRKDGAYLESCPGFEQKMVQKKTRLEHLILAIFGGE